MNSEKYWSKREAEQLKHNITDEVEYSKQLKLIYQNMLDACQNEIDAFYGRYAKKEGISLAEAKKRVSELDIKRYERKAKRYVREKDFSKEANEEMRLYNLTMKVNRLEMLKANIGLELISGHEELKKFMEKILQGRTEAELKRQAGILGKTILSNAKKANSIVNGSFHNATFSQRIWMHQHILKGEIDRLLQVGLIQGKNPRVLASELKKRFDTTTFNAERLMRTELARVQTDAQKKSFEEMGFEMYTFHAIENDGKTCEICKANDGEHFKLIKLQPGLNAPPMHPHCRCSISAYEDSDDYEAWIDYLANGGTTEEWNKLKNNISRKAKVNDGIFETFNATKADSIRPKSIKKEMNKSEIGSLLREYLEKENVPIKLCYGIDNPRKISGEYDPFEDSIKVYCDVTKTVKETAVTVIHEATHRKNGSKGTFEEEVECFKAEVLHKKGKLTENDISDIIEHVKTHYPELKQGD